MRRKFPVFLRLKIYFIIDDTFPDRIYFRFGAANGK